MRWDFATNGTRTSSWQAVAGVKGTAWNWDFDFDFIYSKATTTETPTDGFVALLGDPAAAQLRSRQSVRTADARGAGRRSMRCSSAKKPSTRIATATCSRARRRATSSSFRRAALARRRLPGRQAGARADVQSGAADRRRHRIRRQHPRHRRRSRTTGRLFAEVNIPIVKNLEFNGGGPLRRLQRFRQHDESRSSRCAGTRCASSCSAARGEPASSRRRLRRPTARTRRG